MENTMESVVDSDPPQETVSYFSEDESGLLDVPYTPEIPETSANSTLEMLRTLFPDKQQHMQSLLKIYKLCFPKIIKPIFKKTTEDIIRDIKNSQGSSIMKEQKKALLMHANEEKILKTQIQNIPIFADFAFIYFIWCYDKDAPIHQLPLTGLRFNMIVDAIHADRNISQLFSKCINDSFIKDLRNEKPPFLLRTQMATPEIQEKINAVVKPLFKSILNELIKLDFSMGKKEATAPSETKEAPTLLEETPTLSETKEALTPSEEDQL